MFKRDWKIILRYTLLQVPGIALVAGVLFFIRRWVDLPLWLIWVIVLVFAAKDVILFPFVRRAYDWDQKDRGHAMIGMEGTATERLNPTGYIMVRGELWKAESIGREQPIEKGQKVAVHNIRGLTLYVASKRDP